MDGQTDRWMNTITQIVGLVSGRKYSPSKSMVFKYCEISKDCFLENLERLVEITTLFERMCSVVLERDRKKDVWLSHKDNIALFTANVAQETVLFVCSYQDQLHGV